ALDPHSRHMSLPVLRKIQSLVKAGAVVVGQKPVDTPSLRDDPEEFAQIVHALWGTMQGGHPYGKGRVYDGRTLEETLADLQIQPDFTFTKPQKDTSLLFVHRKLPDGDLYFVNNRANRSENVEATFRVQGKAAELWRADTGDIEPASYRIAEQRT